MTEGTDTSVTAWLNELDDIDVSWNTTTFAQSYPGRLPSEILDSIIGFVQTSDLPAVARISPRLRKLAEKHLYTWIDLKTHNDGGWPRPVYHDSAWMLYCTLSHREDLAQGIKRYSATLFDQEVSINVDTSALFPGDTQLSSAAKVSLQHILIGGRILGLLTNLEELRMEISKSAHSLWWLSIEDRARKEMAADPLAHLLPAFNHATAHTIQCPGLQRLTYLEFGGAEIHWALAKSPCLRKICLTRPCVILSDEAPDEVNTSLKTLTMAARSTILRKNSRRYASFPSFLAHFPSLRELTVRISDFAADELPMRPDQIHIDDELDYTNLLDKISVVAAYLTELDIGVYSDAKEDDTRANDYLRQVLPGPGFQQFKALKSLLVLYQCLLGHTLSLVDSVPSPATTLAPNLESLAIHCPQIYLYDWLARLELVQYCLPELSSVVLYCQRPYGDGYNVFEFEHHDHRVREVLAKIGVELHLDYRQRDWEEEWDNYDLKILDAIEWLKGL